jgi:hypothetical protein
MLSAKCRFSNEFAGDGRAAEPMGTKTHRLPAWGVLGSDNRWDRFSLLTLLFSGVFARLKHRLEEKFRQSKKIFRNRQAHRPARFSR